MYHVNQEEEEDEGEEFDEEEEEEEERKVKRPRSQFIFEEAGALAWQTIF